MRKHLYLVTEHDNEEYQGNVMIQDRRASRSEKNSETPIRKLDEEAGEFPIVGKRVSMGYVDFDTEEPSNEQYRDAIHRKLEEIDERWHEKAGIDLEAVKA